MSINVEVVMKMVEPYIVDNAITYWEFDNLFEMLSKQEQYEVVDVLIKNNIELVDIIEEKDDSFASEEPSTLFEHNNELSNPSQKDFEIKYESSLFEDGKNVGDYVFQFSNVKQNNETLCALIQQGNQQAKNDLCVKNERLVFSIAKRYLGFRGNKLEINDLMQFGFLGLLRAADLFDFNMGAKFSTYAVPWIRQSITRGLADEGFSIRIPVHMFEKVSKVIRLDNRLAAEGNNYQERIGLIASEMAIDIKEVEKCFSIRDAFLRCSSLDIPVDEDGETPLKFFLEDETALCPEQIVELEELNKQILILLSLLTPKEAEIIKMRFGIGREQPMTLEEIGVIYGVTRERIRQIENKALRKLKHPSRRKVIESYWFD